MNQISLLVDLQRIDTRSDANAASRAQFQAALDDTADLNSARALYESTDKQSNDLKSKLRALELETAGLTDKLKTVSDRLYSGRITNAKELAGLNQDEKMLQRRKTELEDQELTLMEQIESAENVLREKRAGFDQAATDTNARHAQERARITILNADDEFLAAQRDSIRSRLPAPTLRLYDDLRATKKGRAVVPLKGDSCSACGTQVPSGLIARLKSGADLVQCTNCNRILTP